MNRRSITYRPDRLAVGLAGIACLVGVSCASASVRHERGGEGEPGGQDLVGEWRKVSASPCAELYPDRLTFRNDGVYLVPQELVRADPFPIWQSGDYEVVDDGRIRIQTSTDAMAAYDFTLSPEGVLSFTDGSGCRFNFERVSE
jgi:hypothetical protein